MSTRKRQLFAVEDVVDILMNGRLSDAATEEENAPPPVKRTSMPNEFIKTAAKLDGSKFYSSPKPVNVTPGVTNSPKPLICSDSVNSPMKPSIQDLSFKNSPLVSSGRQSALSDKAVHSPVPIRTGSRLEALDSPKPSSASKWSSIFFKPSPGSKQEDLEGKKQQSPFSSWLKKAKDKPGDTVTQPILDAGQKEFGVVQCPECSMVYELKSPDDELLHMKHHDSFNDAVRFTAMKNIVPIRSIDGGLQIYQASKESPVQKPLVAKCESVLAIANKEIKRVSDQPSLEKLTQRQKAYICVDPVSSKIVGLCVAEPIARGFPTMSTTWPIEIERDSRKTIAGIRLIWVANDWRRKGIAKALMETVRSTFVYGCVLAKREIAVSPPTIDGFNFFKSYLSVNPQPKPSDDSGSGAAPQQVVFLLYDV